MKFYDRESEMTVYIGSLSKKTLNPTLSDGVKVGLTILLFIID